MGALAPWRALAMMAVMEMAAAAWVCTPRPHTACVTHRTAAASPSMREEPDSPSRCALPVDGVLIPGSGVDGATVRAELEALALEMTPDTDGDSARFQRLSARYNQALAQCETADQRDQLRATWSDLGGLAGVVALAGNPLATTLAASAYTATSLTGDLPRRRFEKIRDALKSSVSAAEAEECKALRAAAAAADEAARHRSVYNARASERFYAQRAAERAEAAVASRRGPALFNMDAIPGMRGEMGATGEPPSAEATPAFPLRLLSRVARLVFGGGDAAAVEGEECEGEENPWSLPTPECASRLAPGGRLPDAHGAGSRVASSLIRATAAARRADFTEIDDAAEDALATAIEMERAARELAALASRARAVAVSRRSKLAAQESAWARQRADARAVGEAVSGLGASVGDAAAEVADLLDGVASAGADKQTRPAVKARASQVQALDSA